MKLVKPSIKKLIGWLDSNLLTIIAGFLLIFIPLYPKWPLFDILPGYNVRVRLEDFLILGAMVYFLIQLLRHQIDLKKAPLLKPMIAYLVIGLLSSLSALFVTKTIYPEYIQVAKLFLHFFRRIEYFSLFFIFFFAIKSSEQIKKFLLILSAAILGVSIYGFGQKYLYWPAYSTMNREFSKGIALYLTEHARVLSTFGGHFDLAAYVMITIIPLIVVGFLHRRALVRVLALSLAMVEYWMLILTASRTSWVGYMVGLTVVFVLLAFKKKWFWVASRWLSVILVSSLVMVYFGDMSERFSHVLKSEGVKSILMRPFVSPPKGGVAFDENIPPEEQLGIVATKSDTPPSADKTKRKKPADVYYDPYPDLATYLATVSPQTTINIDYSENALKYGLSAGIRLDTLWPNALNALKRNPLLGTGYSTLVKSKVWEFTVAESTDNDFLRLLGETGILGFLSFLSIFVVIFSILFSAFKNAKDPFFYGLFSSGIALTIALLVNALYIDVFEASKVAYTYWSIIGLILAAAVYEKKHR